MKINIDGVEIELIYQYKPTNKNIYITYKGNNTFRMSGFYKENPKKIEKFILKNKESILKFINKARGQAQKENTIHYLGKLYNLIEIESERNLVYLKDDTMVVEHKAKASPERLVKAFYIEAIEKYTESVFDSIFSRFSDLNIPRPTLKYKYTKSFYGKCFSKENMIEMSGICMKMETRFIDSVIMHELCHFKYQNHQAGFYRYFEEKLAGCKKIQHEFRSLKYKDIY